MPAPHRPRSTRAIVDHETPVDHGNEIEQLAMFRADEPIDPSGRIRSSQRRRDRNRVHDVAERAEADDQESFSHARVAK